MKLTETNDAVRTKDLAIKTRDAFAFDRYGRDQWIAAVQVLVDAGYDDAEVEWILRSKHMRWAADAGEDFDYEFGVSTIIGRKVMNEYIAKNKKHIDKNLADPNR